MIHPPLVLLVSIQTTSLMAANVIRVVDVESARRALTHHEFDQVLVDPALPGAGSLCSWLAER